jgi:ADP-ribosylglycohydrolase
MQGIDRFVGSFLGLCLGDALGAPVEAASPDVARLYVDHELRAGRAGHRGRSEFPFGQVTDDSQLARELLISIAERREADPAHFASRLGDLVATNRLIGAGPGTIATGRRLQQGIPWNQAGEPAHTAALPCVWHRSAFSGPTILRASCERWSRPGDSPRSPSAAGAVAIAAASMLACRTDRLDPHRVCTELARLAGQVDTGMAAAIEKVERLVAMDPKQATALVRERPDAESSHKWRGVSSEVTGSVCWSLYAFLRSPDDYWETVCTAIGAGGDTDTTAAMAGGIVGARVGLNGLPKELLAQLNDQGEWKVAELTTLAQRCYEACR